MLEKLRKKQVGCTRPTAPERVNLVGNNFKQMMQKSASSFDGGDGFASERLGVGVAFFGVCFFDVPFFAFAAFSFKTAMFC